jgi:galactokinase
MTTQTKTASRNIKREFIPRMITELEKRFGPGAKPRCFRAPGRVDWLGSHTDYNQGLILASTVDREIVVAARLRSDRALNFYSLNLEQEVRTSLDKNAPDPAHGFANYPKGVIFEMLQAGIQIPGIDMVFYGNIPIGANLSSSAAIEAATIEALLGLLDRPMTHWEKAFICWRAENRFVGMPCGILDQFSIINCQKNCVLFLDCDRLASELIPFSFDQYYLLVIDSGVGRQLVKSEYKKRVQECRAAFNALRKAGYNISSLSAIQPHQLKEIEPELEPLLFKRVRHIVTENQRVAAARKVVSRKNFEKLGKLFEQGYLSSSRDYENSCPELDILHDLLANAPGVLGTRIAGAGWGGCLVSIVKKTDWRQIQARVKKPYAQKTQRELRFFPVQTGQEPGEIL